MKVLITGINGFIGQHLAQTLITKKHRVVGIGRNETCTIPGIDTYYSGDIRDKQLVKHAMSNVEAVVHLAALTSHKEIIDNKFETLETNFLGTKNVLDVFSKTESARKFFYSSTGKVYGKIVHLPIDEDHPVQPLNILGKSKFIAERLVDFYNDGQKELIIFRIFNIYGPWQKDNFLVPTILNQVNKGKKEILLGDIKAKRDYVFIDDLVNAFVLAIEKKDRQGVYIYNLCSGRGVSAEEIVKDVEKIKKINITIKTNAALFRHDEMHEEFGSYKKAEKEFGWKPHYTLYEGLKKMLLQ